MMASFLAYIGPDTMLPLTSVIAGAVGVVMLFGRNALSGLRRLFGLAPKSKRS